MPQKRLYRLMRFALGAGLFVFVIGAAYQLTWHWVGGRGVATAEERLTLYETTLESAVERFRYLPQVIALTEPIRDVLVNPDDTIRADEANRHLASVAQAAGADVLFVMNVNGLTLASSNAGEPTSFVGQNYAFRPYFKEAMARGEGRHYAIGATTGKPGYFLASRIDGPLGPKGVAVVKVDLAPMEAEWRRVGERVGLADEHGILFLTSAPDWRYRPLLPLTAEATKALSASRQYGAPAQIGAPLAQRKSGSDALPLLDLTDDAAMFMQERRVTSHGWSLVHLQPVRESASLAFLIASITGLALAALGLFLLVLRERRAHARLRQRAYAELEHRVRARTRDLQLAQDGLVQSAKLAGLGQGLTGIAHEMAQPLAAMRTTLATLRYHVEAGDQPKALIATKAISHVTDRVAALAEQLRNFGRPDRSKPQRLDIRDCVAGALQAIEMRQHGVNEAIIVVGRANRIEQVLVNLLGNAIDSIEERCGQMTPCTGQISLDLSKRDGMAIMSVRDNGVGLKDADANAVFEPFFTTKPAGRGLGLGLAVSRGIAEDHGGSLVLSGVGDAGALALLTLPLAHSGEAAA
jgi:two-component system, NtrC family, C4-dicarboxylate transport sensor histidine kinase DctB